MRPDEHKKKHRAEYKKKHGISNKKTASKETHDTVKDTPNTEAQEKEVLADTDQVFFKNVRDHVAIQLPCHCQSINSNHFIRVHSLGLFWLFLFRFRNKRNHGISIPKRALVLKMEYLWRR